VTLKQITSLRGFPVRVARPSGRWDTERMIWHPLPARPLTIIAAHEHRADWYWQDDEHGRRELCDDRRASDWEALP